jgi:hypothetical protein
MRAHMQTVFFLILIISCGFSQFSQAQMVGWGVGFRQTNLKADSGLTVDSNLGLQAGVLYFGPLTSNLEIRAGAFISQRNFSVKPTGASSSLKSDFNLTYIDVPATVGWAPSKTMTLFAGPLLNLNVSKQSSAGSDSLDNAGIKSFGLGLTAGLTAKFASDYGLEVFIEQPGTISDNTSNPMSVGVNFLILIE